jgi:hypothetical protein
MSEGVRGSEQPGGDFAHMFRASVRATHKFFDTICRTPSDAYHSTKFKLLNGYRCT